MPARDFHNQCAHWFRNDMEGGILCGIGSSYTRLMTCPRPTEGGGGREWDCLCLPSGDAALPKEDSAGIYDNRTQGCAVIKHFRGFSQFF